MTKQRYDNTTGSIMIWTVLLGVALTSVFFFFAIRLNMGNIVQRETIKHQNAQAFFDSYVAYLMANPTEIIDGEYEGIKVTLTQQVEEIEGYLDAGEQVSYDVQGGNANLMWSLCGIENSQFEISTSPTITPTDCLPGIDYAYSAEVTGTFNILSITEPTHYILLPTTAPSLTDNKWHLTAEMELAFMKKVRVDKVF